MLKKTLQNRLNSVFRPTSKLLIPLMMLLLSESVGARENYWVVGSYGSATNAMAKRVALESSLSVPVQIQEVRVGEKLFHRVLIAEANLRDPSTSLEGVTPWLVTLGEKTPGVSSPSISSRAMSSPPKSVAPVAEKQQEIGEFKLLLVGAFTDIDAALTLERQLAEAALPVRGEAKLSAGRVLHLVWVGPTNQAGSVSSRLKELGLEVTSTKLAAAEELSYLTTTENEQPQKSETPAPAPVSKSEKRVTSKYPEDYNLARLPPRRKSE